MGRGCQATLAGREAHHSEVRFLPRGPEVPTFAEAVTAWRGWSLVEVDGEVRLSSLTRPEVWTPRAPHAASCPKGRTPTPQRRCRCGIYAAVTPEASERAARNIEQAEVRARQMARKLRTVEALPGDAAQQVLGLNVAEVPGDSTEESTENSAG